MFKRKKIYESHEDLNRFEKKYNDRIEKFLNSKQETRVVFLNADFGWGKTTFIENNLKIKKNCIYSPWLNPSDNYINEIYYHVRKRDKGIISSTVLFSTLVFTVASLLLGNVISLLSDIVTGNPTACTELVCSQSDQLVSLLWTILKCALGFIGIMAFFIYIKPIPFINFFKKENGQYYEDKLIKCILRKVDKVLVIEDVDRVDDIENVLIAVNKISSYIKKRKIKDKYILLTGDYARVIERITNPNSYNNGDTNLTTYKSKGVFVTEKIISLRIDFSSIQERIDNLLYEYKLSTKLTKIEYDDIINFIKTKYISIRFFVRFLEDRKIEIVNGNSIYHLLVKYYFEQKYFSLESNIYNSSALHVMFFPNCLNDIEMLLKKKKIKVDNHIYKRLPIIIDPKYNFQIINNYFTDLLFNKNTAAANLFYDFFVGNEFPVTANEVYSPGSTSVDTINIGQGLKNNLKNSIDDYLLSYNDGSTNYGNILPSKRCYFNNNLENYKITNVNRRHATIVNEDEFFYAYFGCFFKKNFEEFRNNYPAIYANLMEIIDQHKQEIPVVENDN